VDWHGHSPPPWAHLLYTLRVLETAVVLAGVVLLGTLAFLVASLAPLTLVWMSAAVVGVGCLIGLPTGIGYHVVLRRELLRLGPLPPGWLWSPTKHHEQLDSAGMNRVRPWLWSGGVSFLVIMLGLALMTLTMVTHFR
jgi:hypothetical protein